MKAKGLLLDPLFTQERSLSSSRSLSDPKLQGWDLGGGEAGEASYGQRRLALGGQQWLPPRVFSLQGRLLSRHLARDLSQDPHRLLLSHSSV